MSNDRRLIEDFLPIQAISKEASREKSVRKGHISTLHLWWARRPLVACRAAVYGALVPASRFIPENGPDNKKQSLGRANAAKFIERLCKYPGNPTVIKEAQRHILEAHAERLTIETGKKVTVEDIEEGRAPRAKVLDMFAGGGAIPLEALRLGCEAYALDLNPVAHIIELCTLVYPQKYGKPDPSVRGMTGPTNAKGETTWGGLAGEVRYWGEWVLKKVKTEIGDLYPLIPDPEYQKAKNGGTGFQPVQQALFITERNLPHWQLGGSTYLITFRTKGIELAPEARAIVLDACRYFDGNRYRLWAAVVMPDHVHLLLQPAAIEKGRWHSLSAILHSIKSFTAKKINTLMGRKGSVWQDESFDRIVRDENEFLEKWNYIRNNPVKENSRIPPRNGMAFLNAQAGCLWHQIVPWSKSLRDTSCRWPTSGLGLYAARTLHAGLLFRWSGRHGCVGKKGGMWP
jgi:REP element-mobilizing transposase RayT